MKIILLNLPLDNNYGGNLQRYALMKVLQDMGHDVTHIYLKVHYSLPWFKHPIIYAKRLIKKFIFRMHININEEYYRNIEYEKSLSPILPFYNMYINHTRECYNVKDIIKETRGTYDAILVGSDQVWRKDMTIGIGLNNYFLEFADYGKKRVAYSVSIGGSYIGLSPEEIVRYGYLYKQFAAVSVRETNCMSIFNDIGWKEPESVITLDPVLLLEKKDYLAIIKENNCKNITEGKSFCYILDYNNNIGEKIQEIEHESKLENYIQLLNEDVTIPQWIANLYYANQIITDSYHGVVLSILFCKPFIFLGNERRGNSRLSSLFKILNIDSNSTLDLQWCNIHSRLKELRNYSLCYLMNI